MKKNSRKGKCYMCGDKLVHPLRYRPDELNGRSVLVCEDCEREATYGKFGWENKRYIPPEKVSYYKGRRIRIGR